MSSKIRNLFKEPENGEVVFSDVTDQFIQAMEVVQELEYKDNKNTYNRAIAHVIKTQHILAEFKKRLQGEVLTEIRIAKEERDKRLGKQYRGDPNKIIEANNKRHGRNDPLIK